MTKLSHYKAVILAGGKGTRLYPITHEIPKPLLPIKRKPIINYLIDLFYENGVTDIAILINNDFKEEFDWWKKRYYPKNKIKIVRENKPLGTFGGVYLLKKWLDNSLFFLSNSDELKKIDLKKMAVFHLKKNVLATISLKKIKNPLDYGIVLEEKGFIKKFLEKPSKNILKKEKRLESNKFQYISSGFYLFSPGIFNYFKRDGKTNFLMVEKDLFPRLARDGKLGGFKSVKKWVDTGTWEKYAQAIKNWK